MNWAKSQRVYYYSQIPAYTFIMWWCDGVKHFWGFLNKNNMKCPTVWLKARTEEYCVKPSKQNSFDVCLSRRVSPWTMWVLKSSKFYSCLKTFPPEDLRSFMLKIKKILKPKAHLKCQMSKSTAFWTNFVHRMSPCSRFHTHT